MSRRTAPVGEVTMPAGTTLAVMIAAANRDPRVFEDPHKFKIDRPNARQHVGFGHGIHTCPGAPLARAEEMAAAAANAVLDEAQAARCGQVPSSGVLTHEACADGW